VSAGGAPPLVLTDDPAGTLHEQLSLPLKMATAWSFLWLAGVGTWGVKNTLAAFLRRRGAGPARE